MGAKFVKASCVSTLPRSEVLRENLEIDGYLEEVGLSSHKVAPLIAEDFRRGTSLALRLFVCAREEGVCARREGCSLAPGGKDERELRGGHGEGMG